MSKFISFLILISSVFLPTSVFAQTASTLSIGEPGDSTFRLGDSTTYLRLAQSFTLSGSVSSIQIPLARVGNPTQVITVTIKPSITGTSLYTTTIDPSQIVSTSATSPTWVTITPSAPINMTSGVVTLSVTNTNKRNFYRWRTNSLDSYSGGVFYRNDVAQPSYDGVMRIIYTTSTTPPPPPPSPTVTLTASPLSVTSGQSSTLSWNSTNASGCTASGGWSGAMAVSGTQTVTPASTTLYTLACTGSGGVASSSVTISVTSVTPPPPPPAPAPAPAPSPTPTPTPPPPSPITVQDNGNNFLQVGLGSATSWVNDDVWGAGNLTPGTYTSINGTTYQQANGVSYSYGPNGEISWRMTWKWPTGTTEVKAYPAAITGYKPGCANTWITPCGANVKLPDGTTSQVSPSGGTPNTFFPLQLPIAPLYTSFSYTQNVTPTGRGHLTYDIWLQNTPTQCHGWNACNEITHEIMIPLTYWGNYGSYYGGRNPAWYYKDATIGGRLWHVYHVAPGTGPWTWDFTAFEPDSPTAIPPSTLDLSQFTSYMSAQGWIKSAAWMVSTELGIEPVDGTGDVTVSNYRVWR